MPPSFALGPEPVIGPAEFSPEDAVLNTWVEDNGMYLRLDAEELVPLEEPQSDRG